MSSDRKKLRHGRKYILGIAVALLLPLSFYVLAKVLSKDKLYLPRYYVADGVDPSGDTVFHQAADLQGTDQLNRPVSLNTNLRSKILVVSFFFTNCETVCPGLTRNMVLLQNAFRKNDSTLHLVSVSVDPERDSVPALRAYADRFRADHDHWTFLRAPLPEVIWYARRDLGLSVESDGHGNDRPHTVSVVLLDRRRYVRGVYDGTDPVALRRCAEDAVLLTLEKHKRKRK